jgi:hypothetical protein
VTSNTEHKSYTAEDNLKLFKSFAESLKLPLLHMARSAELSHTTGKTESLQGLMLAADELGQLIDSYILSLELQTANPELLLEPVSLSAMLSEVAHVLQPQAEQQACDLELHIAGRYEPVLANPAGLQAALLSMGQVLIEARSQQTATTRRVIKLAAHRTRYGISAGMFSDVQGLDSAAFRRAKQLYGDAKNPLSQLVSGGGAGVFIASSLLANMSSGLRTARYQKLNGLAATFTPSQQLALVS